MSDAAKSKSKNSGSAKAKALAARLRAVQALYQRSHNKHPVKDLIQEYLDHRADMEIDGEELVRPDGALFKSIMLGVEDRSEDLKNIINEHLKKDDETYKNVQPLIYSIFMCAAYELLTQEKDSPIIINEYLNISHGFFEANEIRFINGVLDNIAKSLK